MTLNRLIKGMLLPASLFAISMAIYLGSLYAPQVFDDANLFTRSSRWTHYTLPDLGTLRWLSLGTFAWTIQLFGDNILWLRLGNVLLHALNVVVLFVFLR
ncbi:MAG: hypothetical protein ACOY3V_09555, partial [Pseudomonadota bacterium]